MGIFDRFRGKPKEAEEPAALSDAQAAAQVASSLDLTEQAAPVPDAGKLLGGFDAEQATRLYNPYEGIGAALDRRDVKGPFVLPKEPEFLFIEEAAVHRRSWSENLTYYTGFGYLTGAIAGGGVGAYQAITSPVTLAAAAGAPSQRLKVNQLLNTSGKMGRTAGNAIGVVGLMFSSSESFFRYLNDGRVADEACSVGAGVVTGALYRSVRGPRQATAAAAVGALAASMLLGARKTINAGL